MLARCMQRPVSVSPFVCLKLVIYEDGFEDMLWSYESYEDMLSRKQLCIVARGL